MTQRQQVVKALELNGGYATLGQLYQLIDFSSWGTKTPYASVRRLVQESPEIFKIKPGLWALEGYRTHLPSHILSAKDTSETEYEKYNHSYFQGLLLEIGNLRGYVTYLPAQDKNQPFLDKRLGDVAQSVSCPPFTYPHVLNRAKTIDVIWFNSRGFPAVLYEVEHSTDFQNSLLKYVELQDFNVQMRIVADDVKKREYSTKVAQSAFHPISDRVKFVTYEALSTAHQKEFAMSNVDI